MTSEATSVTEFVTCRHVLFEMTETHTVKYELKGAMCLLTTSNRQLPLVPEILDDIQLRIGCDGIMVDVMRGRLSSR